MALSTAVNAAMQGRFEVNDVASAVQETVAKVCRRPAARISQHPVLHNLLCLSGI